MGSPGLYRVQLTVITARRGQPQTHTFHFDYYTQAADPARTIAVRSGIDTSPLTALLQSPAPGVYTLPKGTVATLGSVTVKVVEETNGIASDEAEVVTLVAKLLVTQTTGSLYLWQGQRVRDGAGLTVELHVTLPR